MNLLRMKAPILAAVGALALLLALFIVPHSYGEVIDSPDITIIDAHIGSDTLVLLDLDNTIFRSSTTLGSAQWFHHLVKQGKASGLTREAAITSAYPLYCETQRFCTSETCDPRTAEYIKAWQARGYAVLALTARQPVLAPVVVNLLNKLDIDLANNPWQQSQVGFQAKAPACWYQGVIFAHDLNDKGDILNQFLDQVDISQVKKIVFVDDLSRHIDSVQRLAESRGLAYIGLRYGGDDAQVANFDPAIADIQLAYMDRIVPDSVAKKIAKLPEARELIESYRCPAIEGARRDNTLTFSSKSDVVLAAHDVPVAFHESTQIADLLKLADENTLVVFDLNDTLMRTDSMFSGDVWAQKVCKEAVASGLTTDEALDRLVPYWHQALLRAPVRPVEANTARVLDELQRRGCKMMGLTARYTEMAYPTVSALKSIFIDFSANAIAKNDFTLHTASPSKYIDGIVFAGLKNDKAEALVQFLKQQAVTFDSILFIDDKKKNVEGMVKAAQALNKPYIGMWYRAIELGADTYNDDIAKIQQALFGKIIPDAIVQQLVDSH